MDHRFYASSTTDAERIRFSTVRGSRVLGPEEWQRCHEHPRKWVTYRWFWPVGEDPEVGDVEMVRHCDHPDHDF